MSTIEIRNTLNRLKSILAENDAEHKKALADTGFWGKAGAGCIIMATDTSRILIPLRSGDVEEPHTWGTWGGAIDEDEDPKEAAMREVKEEAGYIGQVASMTLLNRFEKDTFRYDTFLAMVETEFQPTLNWESDDAQWFEIGDWPDPLHFGLKAVLENPKAQKIIMSAAN
jgi:8-oxo-dGTP pyrophosphatase MutT (NUDIX family)